MKQLTADDLDGMTFTTSWRVTVHTLHAKHYPAGLRFNVNDGTTPYRLEEINDYIERGRWIPTKQWRIKRFLKQVEQCMQST
jgi:hypothetical protein